MKWLAGAIILAAATNASGCTAPVAENASCGDGKGQWIQDESDTLADGYTVIVRLCIDDGGNVIDVEVD